MSPDAPAPRPQTFAVEFNRYVDGDYNRDLGGKGTLTLRADEPRFLFSGRPRRTLLLGKQPVEFVLRSDQIWNVTRHEVGVAFSTSAGKSGAKQKPFVFTCASEADAATIAAQLPTTQDADFKADAAFTAQIRALPTGGTGLRSVTTWLILANAAAFVVMGFFGAGWFEVASMRPYVDFGANNLVATVGRGEWWRLVTAMFLHYGLLHLLFNMWALLQAGHLVERLASRSLFSVIYFGSGLIGAVTTLYWQGPRVWSAGASGAVFGVYGALLGYLLRQRDAVPRGVFRPLLRSTLFFAGYNLLYGAAHPHIDNAAHLGGLAGGLILGWLAALPLDSAIRARLHRRRLLTTLAFTLVALAVGLAALPPPR